MLKTVKATIDEHGHVHLLEPVKVAGVRHAIVTLLDEAPVEAAELAGETVLLSEAALSDWNRSEEDEAWRHLQPER